MSAARPRRLARAGKSSRFPLFDASDRDAELDRLDRVAWSYSHSDSAFARRWRRRALARRRKVSGWVVGA